MHELSACQALHEQVKATARQHDARVVTRIKVPIGPLSEVESCLLKQAFPIASTGSIAEGAEPILEDLPVQVHCEHCGAEARADADRLRCGRSGDYHTRFVGGDELLLASVGLEKRGGESPLSGCGVKTHV
jgi:hydrogenase nickel incorporation protein HypA/HybF